MKATASAHANTAFVKYWGKRDEKLMTPMNSNISLTSDAHTTLVTVEFSDDYKEDTAVLNGEPAPEKVMERTVKHIDFIRKMAGIKQKARGEAKTNFPIGAGLASSASGFAALTVAACAAAGLKLDKKQLSIVSRQGSGSSCRSIYGGFVEWMAGAKSEDSYAVQLADKNWWDIRDVSVIVSSKQRKVDTRNGMKIAKETSPYYSAWLKEVEGDLAKTRKAIKEKDFTLLGKTAERNSLMMHATAMTATPELIYWVPETLKIMHEVMLLRDSGTECYFSCDTGANVHVFCLPKDEGSVVKRMKEFDFVNKVTIGKPGGDAELSKKHLF